MGKLCQQLRLLAGVALLCFFLPICIAPAAEYVLSQGISFSGISLAITGPEGDPVPEQVAQFLPNMSDISEYCQVTAMEYEEAIRSLEREQVTAVLVLPENFVGGVINGTNPDVEVIIRGDSPMDGLLTLWIGQSASDMLAAVQSGVYAVLELYAQNPPENLSNQDVIARINLRYISWMMNRQDMYRMQTIPVTEQLPVGLHYALSLLAYLVLSLSPFFMPVYESRWLAAQKRYRTVGRGSWIFYLSGLTAGWVIIFVLLAAAQLIIAGGSIAGIIGTSALCALFCTGFAGVCCLLTADTGSCGVLSFICSLVFLALSGGILPPVLMPQGLRSWISCSPVAWIRNTLAVPVGEYDTQPGMMIALAVFGVLLITVGGLLYHRRSANVGDDV